LRPENLRRRNHATKKICGAKKLLKFAAQKVCGVGIVRGSIVEKFCGGHRRKQPVCFYLTPFNTVCIVAAGGPAAA
jgi:hypothetical protein